MAKIPRHGYVCSVDVSSTPTNISSTCGDCDIDITVNMGNVFTADTVYRQNVEGGGKFATVTLTIIRTTGTTEAYRIFNDWLLEATKTARTLTIDSPDSNSGSFRLTGEFSLRSFQTARRSPGSGDAELLQAVLESDGAFTHAVI